MNITTTRYTEMGASLALADLRAGHPDADAADADITAAAGLHEGDAEYRAIHAGDVIGYEGAEGVERAAAEVLRGYRAEAESHE